MEIESPEPSTHVEEEEDECTDGERESESEEESEADEEPQLKYQRVGASVTEILRGDMATCLRVHDKFLALGTAMGRVYILDLTGNEIRKFAPHQVPISDLSVDVRGEYLASCSHDQRVVVQSLYTSEKNTYTFPSALSCVALHPKYAQGKQYRQFVCGGINGVVYRHAKGWFSSKDTELHRSSRLDGPVSSIQWYRHLIAWSTYRGVKIWDTALQALISHIHRGVPDGTSGPDDASDSLSLSSLRSSNLPSSISPPLSNCCIYFASTTEFYVAWERAIKVCRVASRNPGDDAESVDSDDTSEKQSSDGSSLPPRFVEIQSIIECDYTICGLAPFGTSNSQLLVLGYDEDANDEEDSEEEEEDHRSSGAVRPELLVIDRVNRKVSAPDVLDVHRFEENTPKSYRLFLSKAEKVYYIVSPHDIIVAKPRDLDDHIAWLLEKKDFKSAYTMAKEKPEQLHRYRLQELGQMYLDDELEAENFTVAATLLQSVLGDSPQLWELYVYRFHELRQLSLIVSLIPTDHPRLPIDIYELVLNHFMLHQPAEFLKRVTEWNPTEGLYDVENMIEAVRGRVRDLEGIASRPLNEQLLVKALAQLYLYRGEIDKTLELYLRLRSPEVFEFIQTYEMFDRVQHQCLLLMEFDATRAVKLFLDLYKADKLDYDSVIEQLKDHRRHQYLVLHSLFLSNSHSLPPSLQQKLLYLYAEFDSQNLLPFLENAQEVPIDEALSVCRKANLYREEMFVLARMGNLKEALELCMEKVGDFVQAIEFVERQKDAELWADLTRLAMRSAEHVSALLEHLGRVGAHVEPYELIQQIPKNFEIPGLKQKLTRIISDYTVQESLTRGCHRVLQDDCVELMNTTHKQRCKAMPISRESVCNGCGESISHRVGHSRDNILIFFCGHSYHEQCYISVRFKSDEKQQNAVENGDNDGHERGALQPLVNQWKEAARKRHPSHKGVFVCILCSRKQRSMHKSRHAAAQRRSTKVSYK